MRALCAETQPLERLVLLLSEEEILHLLSSIFDINEGNGSTGKGKGAEVDA